MQQTTIKMQSRGVLTLPKKIRDKAGLSSGSLVDVSEQNGEIRIKPASRLDPELLADIRQSLADLKAGRVSPAFSSIKEFKAYMSNKSRKRRSVRM